ncbi:MAG TPA: NTP transferase domain-containing protein [Turneriella sp.]|nr:NTP transferase domain-containing protein [Turneriella sp.]
MQKSPFQFRAVVQARLTSERLPKKVLEKIGDKTIIEHIAARVESIQSAGISLLFAIAEENDSLLSDFLREKKLPFVTGHPSHVLKRFIDAATDLNDDDYVIRLTADNPFIDKDRLAALVERLKERPVDYAYTADLPLGMGSEAIRVAALRSVMLRDTPLRTGGEAGLKDHHREHVTIFIRENPHLYEIFPFRLDSTITPEAAKARVTGIRMTIDEAADLAVARQVYAHFAARGLSHFGALDVIELSKNDPSMLATNRHVEQRAATSVDTR